jgi:uncharacterized protein
MDPYLILITPFISAVIAQGIKMILAKRNQAKIKDLIKLSYAGMPSGHSAFVSSLVTIVALVEGVSSPFFALALAFAVIVINDALKLRQFLGRQGAVINSLIKDLKEDQFLDQKYPLLKERIGHTMIEVSAGILLGIAVAILIFNFF